MIGVAKVLGRLLALFVNKGVIQKGEALWILEPLKDDAEGGENELNDLMD